MSPPPNFKNEGLTGSQFLEGMGRRGGGGGGVGQFVDLRCLGKKEVVFLRGC